LNIGNNMRGITNSPDLLIIIPPEREQLTVYPPYGSMYIGAALREKSYKPSILNLDAERISTKEVVERIRVMNPKYIGYSGIVSTSYKFIKGLSWVLRQEFPKKIQILGGGLAAAPEPVLRHTAIDIVVHGEGDITITELLDHLENKTDLNSVKGISFRTNGSYAYTGRRSLIKNIDILPYPAFDLIDMDRYLVDGIEFIYRFVSKLSLPDQNRIVDKRIYDPKRKRKMITIPTSRGCFGNCTFCYRAYRGIRTHSLDYIFNFIEYCIDKFDVGFFTFGDECFAPNKEWNWKFLKEFKKRDLDIIFRILGMRVDTVDKEILQAYKEAGCWMIEYGFESGNQKMLNIMEKGVSVQQNRNAGIWTNEAGMFTSPTLVLGMPGETEETIKESIEFIKSLNFGYKQYQWTYALPMPGAPLYEYAKLRGIIDDEDKYLESIAGCDAGNLLINLTEEPDEVVASWSKLVSREIDKHYFYRKYKSKIVSVLILTVTNKIYAIKTHLKTGTLLKALKRKLREFFISLYHRRIEGTPNQKHISSNQGIEELIQGLDFNRVNRAMSLRKVNQKLRELKYPNERTLG